MASRKPSAESLARQIFESQTRRHANGRKLPFYARSPLKERKATQLRVFLWIASLLRLFKF